MKESLKKALSGGVTLGLTIQPKAGSSGLQVRSRCCFLAVISLLLSTGFMPSLIIFLVSVCVCSRPQSCDGPRSLRPSPAATPATQSPAPCRSTVPHCSAGSQQARRPRQSGDTSSGRPRSELTAQAEPQAACERTLVLHYEGLSEGLHGLKVTSCTTY